MEFGWEGDMGPLRRFFSVSPGPAKAWTAPYWSADPSIRGDVSPSRRGFAFTFWDRGWKYSEEFDWADVERVTFYEGDGQTRDQPGPVPGPRDDEFREGGPVNAFILLRQASAPMGLGSGFQLQGLNEERRAWWTKYLRIQGVAVTEKAPPSPEPE
jgi:hypothetical protein